MSNEVDDKIAKHRGLIFKQLRKFGMLHDADAESLAYEALYNAVSTFDATRGFQFSTYATVCIYNALGSYLRTLNRQRQIVEVSYNAVTEEEDGENMGLLSFLCTESDTEREYLTKERNEALNKVLDEQVSRLSNEKHQRIITVWREAGFDKTTSSIAQEVGVSQSYVSQVINNFKYTLRVRLEEVYLD